MVRAITEIIDRTHQSSTKGPKGCIESALLGQYQFGACFHLVECGKCYHIRLVLVQTQPKRYAASFQAALSEIGESFVRLEQSS